MAVKADEGHKAYLSSHSQKAFSVLSEISKNLKKKLALVRLAHWYHRWNSLT